MRDKKKQLKKLNLILFMKKRKSLNNKSIDRR